MIFAFLPPLFPDRMRPRGNPVVAAHSGPNLPNHSIRCGQNSSSLPPQFWFWPAQLFSFSGLPKMDASGERAAAARQPGLCRARCDQDESRPDNANRSGSSFPAGTKVRSRENSTPCYRSWRMPFPTGCSPASRRPARSGRGLNFKIRIARRREKIVAERAALHAAAADQRICWRLRSGLTDGILDTWRSAAADHERFLADESALRVDF